MYLQRALDLLCACGCLTVLLTASPSLLDTAHASPHQLLVKLEDGLLGVLVVIAEGELSVQSSVCPLERTHRGFRAARPYGQPMTALYTAL